MNNCLRLACDIEPGQQKVILVGTAHQHIVARRLKSANHLVLFHDGYEYDVAITEIGKHHTEVTVISSAFRPTTRRFPLKLCLAALDSQSMDFALVKACELGVDEIIIWPAMRSQGRGNKWAQKIPHFIALLKEACAQCQRTEWPKLYYFPDQLSWITNRKDGIAWFGVCYAPCRLPDSKLLQQPQWLAIGPEGGWIADEVDQFLQYGWQPWCFSRQVLRAETAAICGIGLLACLQDHLL